MILLGQQNTLIASLLEPLETTTDLPFGRSTDPKSEFPLDCLDSRFSDFNGLHYHLFTSCDGCLGLEITIVEYDRLASMGVMDYLRSKYPDFKIQETSKHCICMTRSIVSASRDESSQIRSSLSQFRTILFSFPFYKALEQTNSVFQISFGQDKNMYVVSSANRIDVIFDLYFSDRNDAVLAKVFAQEFAGTRRSSAMQNAPQILFDHHPPQILGHVESSKPMGYMTLVLFPRHYQGRFDVVAGHAQTLRNYLGYHIKCTKSFLQSRLRSKEFEYLKLFHDAHSSGSV